MQGELDEALNAFEAVVKRPAKDPAEIARHFEAMIGKATVLTKKKMFAEAIQTIDSIIEKTSGDNTRVLAEAYVRKGDCLREEKKPKEAVLAYLHVPVLFKKENSLHAEALYHLAQLAGGVGEPRIADDARTTLETEYPESKWAEKLAGG